MARFHRDTACSEPLDTTSILRVIRYRLKSIPLPCKGSLSHSKRLFIEEKWCVCRSCLGTQPEDHRPGGDGRSQVGEDVTGRAAIVNGLQQLGKTRPHQEKRQGLEINLIRSAQKGRVLARRGKNPSFVGCPIWDEIPVSETHSHWNVSTR